MAWNTIRDTGALAVEAEPGRRSGRQVIVSGFIAPGSTNVLGSMLWLSAVFMAVTFVVFVGCGLFAAAVRDHVISRPRVPTWVRRVFSGAFVALGARLAFAQR